jgi:hypothetical protein
VIEKGEEKEEEEGSGRGRKRKRGSYLGVERRQRRKEKSA